MKPLVSVALLIALFAPAMAQKTPAAPASPAPAATAATPAATPGPPDEESIYRTRRELLQIMRVSPRLSETVARDASLLADTDYVTRKNPELAKFLAAHPEIVRNPEFYLYAGGPGERLDDIRFNSESERERVINRTMNEIGPVVVLVVFLIAGFWLVRVVLDNLRWKRILLRQTEVHNKLLDKFGSSQELLNYMQTDAGKRFLEAAPISVAIGSDEPQWGSPVARIMRPLQMGIVLSATGIGLMSNAYEVLQTLGKIVLMVGFGFIISAGASWLIARHAGLLEPRPTENRSSTNAL